MSAAAIAEHYPSTSIGCAAVREVAIGGAGGSAVSGCEQ